MKFEKSKPVTDIERKMFLKEIQRLTDERNEYAAKYEFALSQQKEYEELVVQYKKNKKKQEELIKQSEDMIKDLGKYRDSLMTK